MHFHDPKNCASPDIIPEHIALDINVVCHHCLSRWHQKIPKAKISRPLSHWGLGKRGVVYTNTYLRFCSEFISVSTQFSQNTVLLSGWEAWREEDLAKGFGRKNPEAIITECCVTTDGIINSSESSFVSCLAGLSKCLRGKIGTILFPIYINTLVDFWNYPNINNVE